MSGSMLNPWPSSGTRWTAAGTLTRNVMARSHAVDIAANMDW